ncbi:MAG: hypothetical protein ACFCUE_09620 [Candidatus Bathyarchaeia archaeon]|jgi:hypothetical protein
MKQEKVVIFSLLTAFLLLSVSLSNSSQYDNLDNQTKSILSDVLGLDLTKYILTANDSTGVTSVPYQTGDLNLEPAKYYLKSDNALIGVLSIFYNGQLAVVNLDPAGNDSVYSYTKSPGTDLKNQADNLLSRYAEVLSQTASVDVSFLTSMRNVLSTTDNNLSAVDTTMGNINFQASKDGNTTKLQWIYFDYDTVMNPKRVELTFNNFDLVSFQDTWRIFKVAGPNTLSEEQAKKIALDAAQKVPLHLSNSKGENITIETHDLSNARYDFTLNMLPCYSSDADLTSRLSLDPLTLYPFWRFHFYFNETIANIEGIQVGVLGDTGEIYSVGTFGYLGGGYSTLTDVSSDDAASSTSNNFLGIITIATITAVLLLIVSVPIVLRRSIRKRK